MVQQQLLDLFNREYEFNAFIATGNEISVSNLQSFSSQFTHLYGEHLTGKTHLLKAWTNLANHKYRSALYLDSAVLVTGDLRGIDLDLFRFIALDNINLLSDELQIELFDVFNHIKLQGRANYLLTSSSVNLNHSDILRIDLKTRIYSDMVFALKNLTEDELFHALSIYTNREGIKIGETELKYLLTHYTRNLGKLIELINQISQAATMQKKAITIHLIKHNDI